MYRYNLIRIAIGAVCNNAFHTKQGLCKYLVMPFNLTNTSILFQEMMHAIFTDMEGCIWCLNHILNYGCNAEEDTKLL